MSDVSRGVLAVIGEVERTRRRRPHPDVLEGVAAIRVALAELGLGEHSERTVRRMLKRGDLPAVKVGKLWVSSWELLAGKLDTVRRAQAGSVCLCRWCPQHGPAN